MPKPSSLFLFEWSNWCIFISKNQHLKNQHSKFRLWACVKVTLYSFKLSFNFNFLKLENILLSQVLTSDITSFERSLTNFFATTNPINSTIRDMILTSNPNFIHLYSQYSTDYSEPLLQFSKMLKDVPQEALNLFYGSNLDVSRIKPHKKLIK